MAHKPQSAAIIIADRHRKTPKAHWADREIQKAAEEIDSGRYVEEPRGEGSIEQLNVALGFGNTPTARRGYLTHGEAMTEYADTDVANRIGMHPRVVEAMAKMREEVETLTNPQEIVEKQWMLHEMQECHDSQYKWEGQNRWEGRENREARMAGECLTPWQFIERLQAVIGMKRVMLGTGVVKLNENGKSGLMGLYIHNPLWEGDPMIKPEYARSKAAEFRKAAERELVEAKRLRLSGQTALADRAFHRAGDMIQAATELLHNNMVAEQTKEPELLRVGTLQAPLGTEWMVMRFNEFGVPTTAEFLGWRTALLTMVRSKIITEAEAHVAFPVGEGVAAEWYQQQLYLLRNPGELLN